MADSLAAIKKLVYEEKKITPEQLWNAESDLWGCMFSKWGDWNQCDIKTCQPLEKSAKSEKGTISELFQCKAYQRGNCLSVLI